VLTRYARKNLGAGCVRLGAQQTIPPHPERPSHPVRSHERPHAT